MSNIKVYDMTGAEVGEMELNESVFEAKINVPLMHQAVVGYQASLRSGTHQTKTRSDVNYSTKKLWRQKGTGRARSGSRRNPVWVGGGISFGPHPRSYGYKMPKKMRQAALRSALSDKYAEGNLLIVDELTLEAPKTKAMVELFNNFDVNNALIVMGEFDDNVMKSIRNVPGFESVEACGINVYNILVHNKLIMTKAAVAKAEEVLAK